MSIKQAEKECRAAWEAHPDATWAWCLHHELRLEPLIEPYQARIAYILEHKPTHEQVTRLNNFRPVLSKLPAKIIKALEACDKALEAYDKAWEAHVEAWEAYYKAWEAYKKAREVRYKAREAFYKALDAYKEAILANTTKLQALHTKDV